jgi:cytochrome c oxidase cbb3-type subunit 3
MPFTPSPAGQALTAALLLAACPAWAQAQASPSDTTIIVYVLLGLLLLAVIGILFASLAIARLTWLWHQQLVESAADSVVQPSLWVRLKERFITGKLVPVAQEHAILTDHSYDGIYELDNRMPPWLRYVFVGTIVFAAVYMLNFAVLGLVETSEQEYVAEMAQAEKDVAAFQLTAAKGINEENAQLLTDAAILTAAKGIYRQNCQACHGAAGEGGVGPNLTDEFWLHGGDVKSVFKTIKYGVPQKGMIAWEQKLQPDQIEQVASYVLSLQGTQPPNGKAPQGEKFTAGSQPTGKEVSLR